MWSQRRRRRVVAAANPEAQEAGTGVPAKRRFVHAISSGPADRMMSMWPRGYRALAVALIGGSVLLGGVGVLAVVALWFKLFPALAQRDSLQPQSRPV